MPALESMTRDLILERYRERIALGRRIKLYSGEFDALVEDFIQQLARAHTREQIQQICADEIALLEEGYKQATLASDYIPKYRKAIEQAIADGVLKTSQDMAHHFTHWQRVTGIQEHRSEHWALTFFKYDREVYEDLDSRQAQLNRKKLLNLKAVNPHRYLAVLEKLLDSQDKFRDRHMAVAIAGLTGRRLGEVLARGSFGLTDHPYLLHFEGQQKYERSGYDIVTLIPAPALLLKIEEFRRLPEIKGLMRLTGEALTQAINKFDVQVNRECHKYLSQEQVVPPLQHRKRVTIHNLRSLWGAIAVWMFCPPRHHEYAFIQHYLGHVLESSATGHYFRYRLVDRSGQVLREQGTLLTQVPELPLIEDELDDDGEEPIIESVTNTRRRQKLGKEQKQQQKSVRKVRKAPDTTVNRHQAQEKASQMELLEPTEQSQAKLRADWERDLAALRQEMLEQITALARPEESQGVLWLAERVAFLEAKNQALVNENRTLIQEREALKQKLAHGKQAMGMVQQLEDEKRSLLTQLNEAQAKLDGFRELLLGNSEQDAAPQKTKQGGPVTQIPETTQTSKKRKAGRKPGQAMRRAQNIFDALRAWNTQHPDLTVAFSPGLLETGFRIHRKAAKQFCEDFRNEINDHHAEIGVENAMSHNRGKNLEKFKGFVEQFC